MQTRNDVDEGGDSSKGNNDSADSGISNNDGGGGAWHNKTKKGHQ